jgi:hypothetical protein
MFIRFFVMGGCVWNVPIPVFNHNMAHLSTVRKARASTYQINVARPKTSKATLKRIETLEYRSERYHNAVCPFDPPNGYDYENNRTKKLACRWHKRQTLRINGLTREISKLETCYKRIVQQKERATQEKRKRKTRKKRTVKGKPNSNKHAIMAIAIRGTQAVSAIVIKVGP